MRRRTLLLFAILTFDLSGSAALAMPGATVGIPLGSPDPFGTMTGRATPPETAPSAGPEIGRPRQRTGKPKQRRTKPPSAGARR